MAVQYWVGDFFIDLSRNQITQISLSQSGQFQDRLSQDKQSQIMAPKALAVLTYLAENQGKVVSQDALFNKVWQDTVVSPNTLQRSIAQLRKALGDDGKGQVTIKTHAKQGYSLECDVRWQGSNDSATINGPQDNLVDDFQEKNVGDNDLKDSEKKSSENKGNKAPINYAVSETDSTSRSKPLRFSLRLISFAAGIFLLGVVGYQTIAPKRTSSLTFDTLRSLTATDDKEFDATYSPDGQYIVFHRYLDNRCGNKLWAKNTRTQEEIPLTQGWGDYGSHSFSKDGKKLVFIETEACTQPVTQNDCYNLVSLDFSKALVSPQQPEVMLRCKNSIIKKPIWLTNDNIALMQRLSNRWKLIDYSVSKNNSTDLYALNDGNLIDFAYSGSDDFIAVTSIHSDGQHYIDMLKPNGRILSSHPIVFPLEISKFRPIYPYFDPTNKQLVFSTGKQLFTLTYDGKISKISLPFDERMVPTEFHPDGRKLLLIKGRYDSDIAFIPFNQITETGRFNRPYTHSISKAGQTQLEGAQTYSSFERSNLGEDSAIFQPGGELIAFRSERSGEEQLWISDGNSPQQLTQFPMDTYIRGIDWAEDGKSLLVNVNGGLTQVYLDSSQLSFPMQYSIVQLYQWDSNNNTALLLVLIKGVFKLVEYNLNNSEIRVLSDKTVLWAGKSEDGRLIYKDQMSQFWQPGPAEAQLIQPLEKQYGKSKSFVIKGNKIFAINRKNQLWSYDLNVDSFNILGEVGENIDNLTDINQSHLLMTVRVAERKEVVELSLSE